MTELTDAEMQVLVTLRRARRMGVPTTEQGLLELAEARMGPYCLDWTGALQNLVDYGLLDSRGEAYALTDNGEARTDEVEKIKPMCLYWYNEFYRRAESSEVHGEFLKRVYGANLCQHGMMNQEQLHVMIDLLKLGQSNRVLDIGSGNGMIAEYISDVTGARVVGTDIADDAIRRAMERTESKRDRLSFEVLNMYGLDLPPASFDTVTAIDSLYFVGDMEDTVRQVLRLLKPGGQMGFFYGTMILGRDTQEEVLPDGTALAGVFRKIGLEYRAIDFTESDRAHWRLKKEVLLELRPRFEDEGNMFLYDNRIAECEAVPENIPGRRYLYHVWAPQ